MSGHQSVKNDNKAASNFSLGQDRFSGANQFVSLQREAMESVTAQGGGYISTIDKNQRELNAARKAEARSTTFNLGNA